VRIVGEIFRGVICYLLVFTSISVFAQFGNPSTFQVMQSVEVDTNFQIDPSAAVWCPGIPINKKAAIQVAFFKLMEFKNWQQISFTAKRQIQAVSAIFQGAIEKTPTAITASKLSLQLSRKLGEHYGVGVQVGLLRKNFRYYQPISIPFAQMGCWTAFSAPVTHAMSVGFSSREIAFGFKQTRLILLLRSMTSLQVTKALAFKLQFEKLTAFPFYWQLGFVLLASNSIQLQVAHSVSPHWWLLHFQFPMKMVNLKISLGFQPLLGTVSGFDIRY